jgi:hypothetical protein
MMTRTALLLIALASAPASAASERVTLRLENAPVAEAAAEISRATGRSVRLDGVSGTVTLSLVDVPSGVAVRSLARAAGAELSESGDEVRLTPHRAAEHGVSQPRTEAAQRFARHRDQESEVTGGGRWLKLKLRHVSIQQLAALFGFPLLPDERANFPELFGAPGGGMGNRQGGAGGFGTGGFGGGLGAGGGAVVGGLIGEPSSQPVLGVPNDNSVIVEP